MAKEYIEREAATAYAPLPKHLRDYQTMNLDDAWENGYDFAIRQLSSIPAADVAPVVRGRWVRSEDADDGYCSNCKCDMPMCREDWEWKYCETDYCPNCGAKMDGGQDDA